jgi:hypothetical protein
VLAEGVGHRRTLFASAQLPKSESESGVSAATKADLVTAADGGGECGRNIRNEGTARSAASAGIVPDELASRTGDRMTNLRILGGLYTLINT